MPLIGSTTLLKSIEQILGKYLILGNIWQNSREDYFEEILVINSNYGKLLKF